MSRKKTADDLREKLIEKAIDLLDYPDGTDKVDIFKAVAAFYVGETKVAGKKAVNDEDGTFDALRKKLAPSAPQRLNGGS